MNDDFWAWMIAAGAILLVLLIIVGLAVLGNYLMYGNVDCMFANCIKVVP